MASKWRIRRFLEKGLKDLQAYYFRNAVSHVRGTSFCFVPVIAIEHCTWYPLVGMGISQLLKPTIKKVRCSIGGRLTLKVAKLPPIGPGAHSEVAP